jgi:hypothetical protein
VSFGGDKASKEDLQFLTSLCMSSKILRLLLKEQRNTWYMGIELGCLGLGEDNTVGKDLETKSKRPDSGTPVKGVSTLNSAH